MRASAETWPTACSATHCPHLKPTAPEEIPEWMAKRYMRVCA
jgi:hypothetical protein